MTEKKVTERARQVVSDAAVDLGEVMAEGLEEARERFDEAAAEFENKARRTRREMRRRAEELGGGARERYDAAVEGVQRGYRKVRKDAAELGEDVNAYVRANPGTAILIAAGAGFVLGMLLRGGRRREEI